MRGSSNHKLEEEEGVALVQVAEDYENINGCKTTKQQPDHGHDNHSVAGASNKAAEEAGYSYWSSAVKKRVRAPGRVGLVVGGFVLLALLAAVATTWQVVDFTAVSSFLQFGNGGAQSHRGPHRTSSRLVAIPFTCGINDTSTCPRFASSAPAPAPAPSSSSPPAPQVVVDECPSYFRHMELDLEAWVASGITREAVERGRRQAHFRLVVVGGRAYVETYRRAFQTRDVFTQWGILQLLRRYPGRVPDLDLMFNCDDMPEVRAAAYPDRAAAPPLFRYCKDPSTLDVLFPDWSFWGWPEVNIRPWAPLLAEMAEENARLPWQHREPYAYWKGNPNVSPLRQDLLRCNHSDTARFYRQDWAFANRNGFRDSNLARQCRHRYKMYVQGRSWSVSRKYILACDSPVLAVATPYQDFFSRGLVAGNHYWPIDPSNSKLCRDIRFAVRWGNAHPAQAQRMGLAGSAFARDDMAMDYVYDYMLHVLTRYASLLRYKPTVPERAVELCPESMACPRQGRERDFMMQSREQYVADYEPCTMPPPPPLTADDATKMAHRDAEVLSNIDKMIMADKHR
uniref:Glycosyl transferase CAP10 domain-containing protein n=1 Tax=Oryza punctata TaxID=4537 RepID=A0A0E0LQA9_ORYPU